MQRATFRSAEDLYAQLPVRDVIRVLAKTKQDAEKKREELRDLVGHRYHDLIDSADGIISMNSTVTEFEKTLLTIEQSAAALLALQPAKQQPPPQSLPKQQPLPQSNEEEATVSESASINLVLKAPSQIWAALDSGNELKACKTYLRACDAIRRLGLFAEGASPLLDDGVGSLPPSSSLYDSLAVLAERDRAAFGGEWQLRFPFLLSQARLVMGDCQADIVQTCHAAFAERHISASRVEKAMEALLLLKQVTNPTETLLQARGKLLDELLLEGDENTASSHLLALAELLFRTVGDCNVLQRHAQQQQKSPAAVKQWLADVAQPRALAYTQLRVAEISSLDQLALVQTSIHQLVEPDGEAGDVDQVYAAVFASPFALRAQQLRDEVQAATLRRIKRLLRRNRDAASHSKALSVLQEAITDNAGAAWVERDLLPWLEANEDLPAVGRFAAAAAAVPSSSPSVLQQRLQQVAARTQAAWVQRVVHRLMGGTGGDQDDEDSFAKQLELLPWRQPQQRTGAGAGSSSFSSAMGGWQRDESTHGDLPCFPSWPCSELCFRVASELDQYMEESSSSPEQQQQLQDVRRMLGDAAWRQLHLMYSALAKTATSADGKLQAAFDLEYAALVLLGPAERTPLPFTNGGVDVYACSSVIKARARAFAAQSGRLGMASTTTATPATMVPSSTAAAASPNLQTLVPPVPRFALLPVPQRNTTSSKLAASSPRTSSTTRVVGSPSPKVVRQQQQQQQPVELLRQNTLGRVLGWLS